MPPLALKPNGGNMPSLTKKICSVEGCSNKYFSTGYCSTHFQRQWKIDHPLYSTWSNMLHRCYQSKAHNYSYYGARGVQVCERWLTYQNFEDDMLRGYKRGLTLDRYPNKDCNYEPSNVRWPLEVIKHSINDYVRVACQDVQV
jgi:hypothetical protein